MKTTPNLALVFTIEGYSETEVYYSIDGKCYMIKAINSIEEEHENIVNEFHHSEGVLLTRDNVPVNCPDDIAFKYLA